MRHSFFPSDDSLPTWLHTLLLLLIVSPFSVFLLWVGADAIATAHLEPLEGPDFREFFFGPTAINGTAAKVAGGSLIVLGCAFAALTFNYSRFAHMNRFLRLLPWILVAIHIAMSFWVQSLT